MGGTPVPLVGKRTLPEKTMLKVFKREIHRMGKPELRQSVNKLRANLGLVEKKHLERAVREILRKHNDAKAVDAIGDYSMRLAVRFAIDSVGMRNPSDIKIFGEIIRARVKRAESSLNGTKKSTNRAFAEVIVDAAKDMSLDMGKVHAAIRNEEIAQRAYQEEMFEIAHTQKGSTSYAHIKLNKTSFRSEE